MEFKQNGNVNMIESALWFTPNVSFDIQADFGTVYTPGELTAVDSYRILYCRCNSNAEAVIGDEHYSLGRGDILMVKPHTTHGFLSYGNVGEPYIGYVVTVSEGYVQKLLRIIHQENFRDSYENSIIHTRGTLWERVDNLFIVALEEQEVKAPGWETALLGDSIVLMIQIGRAASSESTAAARSDKQELLTGILSYVESNLGEKITLEDVANRFFVSSSTVTHMFAKKMNISFYKYVMQRRLWQAKNLIKEDMPMERIAAKVGFGDYSAFYRAFKQEFHMSPRQYHKEIRGGGEQIP